MDKQVLRKDSDVRLRITIADADGNPIDPSRCDLWFQLYTSRTRRLVMQCRHGDPLPPGMQIDEGQVVLSVDAPGFSAGPLRMRFRTRAYDPAFPDGFYDFASQDFDTGIIVVK